MLKFKLNLAVDYIKLIRKTLNGLYKAFATHKRNKKNIY